MNKNISVVIVTYNSKDVITQCIKSIKPFVGEVIVVDNNSSDDTLKLVRKISKTIKIIENDKNIGYGKACNMGIKKASKGYVAVINPDIVVKKDVFTPLTKHFIEDFAFMTAPMCYRDKAKNKTISTEKYLKKCQAIEIGRHLYDAKFISRTFFVVSKGKWNKIGGFDENIFFCYEDDEICKRALKEGYKLIIDRNIRIDHERKTIGSEAKIRTWHKEWSKLYLEQKHHDRNIAISRIIRNIFSIISNLVSLRMNRVKICMVRIKAAVSFLKGQSSFKKDGSGYLTDI